MIISVIGPSGSGKGSLAAYLEREHGFHVVATGQLFRRHLQDATDLGRAASTYLRNGELVPGEIVEERLVGRLVCSHCHETYHRTHRPPRNRDVGLCDACGSPLQRRPEDVPDLIGVRLRNFRLGAEDVLDYYQHDGRKLIAVDGEGSPDEVWQRVLTVVDEAESAPRQQSPLR